MPVPLSLFAFGMGNLAMLGWLAAAAAPILIHLWSRQKHRETRWAAMEYLLAALHRQSRRMRFEQWLLLAIRTLLIVLLVLAVAEPFLERTGLAFSSAGRTHRVLVMDGSYSMGCRLADKSRFDEAKGLARTIVEAGWQGDAFSLVLMASPPRVVVGKPALDKEELLAEIDGLRMLHTTADLPATIEAVEQVVQTAHHEDPNLARHEVYFLTDLGRVGWVPRLSGAAAEEFRKRCASLSESALLAVIDVGQPAVENVAVTSLQLLEPLVTPARSVGLQATLKSFGRQGVSPQSVELLVDGRRVAQRDVDLGPGEEVTVGFSYRFDSPGDHAVEVRAQGDALDVDNHRWMAVPVRRAVRALCIDGRPSGEPFAGASDYLAVALSPEDTRAGPTGVEADVAAESALRERALGQYDVVFLCDVGQFTPNEARVLYNYVENGGCLVVFLGPQVLAERYNRELLGGADLPRLLPAEIGPLVAESQLRLDPLEYRHPIVQAFRGRPQAGLVTTPVYKHYNLALPKDSRAKVVLKTANGDPLIVEEPIERGRVVLVATSADASWTDLPVWPSFVPIVQELLAFCVAGQQRQRNVEVGQALEATVPDPAANLSVSVQGPDGRSRAVRLRSRGDYGLLSYAQTMTSGIYRFRYARPVGRTEGFAVNVDTAESDLTKLREQELRKEVWPGIAFDHLTEWQNPDRGSSAPLVRPARLHVGLLYGVLALLFVETVLAWRFGHHGP